MRNTPIDRRQLLQRAAVLLGAGAAYKAVAAAPAPAACVAADDPNSSLRRSLNYTESGSNPAQRCSACSFYSEPGKSCGKCTIFGGPTNNNGHCDSWAAKA